ncbi:Uncharacterized protein PIL02S_01912 [Paenibacillus illinoisensis]|uniref:Uncharacterized protein n=1 Tax=Paenibacillus illinoisensis TaxID=59845 RepID=A0A2W0CI32_9BACL|nr:Uncharacterized protein PIL02S_01912 [Paenibacillus illinoisensis]
MPAKYLGWLVEIIYEDQSGKIYKAAYTSQEHSIWAD